MSVTSLSPISWMINDYKRMQFLNDKLNTLQEKYQSTLQQNQNLQDEKKIDKELNQLKLQCASLRNTVESSLPSLVPVKKTILANNNINSIESTKVLEFNFGAIRCLTKRYIIELLKSEFEMITSKATSTYDGSTLSRWIQNVIKHDVNAQMAFIGKQIVVGQQKICISDEKTHTLKFKTIIHYLTTFKMLFQQNKSGLIFLKNNLSPNVTNTDICCLLHFGSFQILTKNCCSEAELHYRNSLGNSQSNHSNINRLLEELNRCVTDGSTWISDYDTLIASLHDKNYYSRNKRICRWSNNGDVALKILTDMSNQIFKYQVLFEYRKQKRLRIGVTRIIWLIQKNKSDEEIILFNNDPSNIVNSIQTRMVKSIDCAIANMVPNDEIVLDEGSYECNFQFKIYGNLIFRRAHNHKSNWKHVILNSEENSKWFVWCVGANTKVEMEGVLLRSMQGNVGIVRASHGAKFVGNDCLFHANGLDGFCIENESVLCLKKCKVIGSVGSAIHINPGCKVILEQTTISNCGLGYECIPTGQGAIVMYGSESNYIQHSYRRLPQLWFPNANNISQMILDPSPEIAAMMKGRTYLYVCECVIRFNHGYGIAFQVDELYQAMDVKDIARMMDVSITVKDTRFDQNSLGNVGKIPSVVNERRSMSHSKYPTKTSQTLHKNFTNDRKIEEIYQKAKSRKRKIKIHDSRQPYKRMKLDIQQLCHNQRQN